MASNFSGIKKHEKHKLDQWINNIDLNGDGNISRE